MNETLFFALEIAGTVAFAVSGVIVAIEKKLDIFGAVVLGLVTSVGGGMMRDLILGYVPPAAFRHPVYSLTAIGISVLVYVIAYFYGRKIKQDFEAWSQVINVFDSIGLAVFTVGGINSAHSAGFPDSEYLSIFVGVLTACGGGVLRDLMANRVPVILKKRVYALASIFGGVIYHVFTGYNVISESAAVIVSVACILIIRILATVFRWNLPRIKFLADEDKND